MLKSSIFLFSSFALIMTTGCATVTRGKYDVLEIQTQPPGAQVQTSNGYSCQSTPCGIRMPRRSSFNVTITRPGCRPATVQVTHKTADGGAAGVAGNVLVGGVIGLGVDAATGASQDLVPNPVSVRLQCRQ